MNTYAPSTMIVTMSWVSFWLKVDAVPARVALSITSLLTLCTQVQQYKAQLPPVSYIKAMDIWLFVCIIMVFSTLLEFAISYNIHSKKCQKCSNTHTKASSPDADEEDKDDRPKTITNTWVAKDKTEKVTYVNSANTVSTSQTVQNKECSECLNNRLLG
ncbi:Glycine receptor subunit alpha-3, partial [Stegodyphus mimosarum]